MQHELIIAQTVLCNSRGCQYESLQMLNLFNIFTLSYIYIEISDLLNLGMFLYSPYLKFYGPMKFLLRTSFKA